MLQSIDKILNSCYKCIQGFKEIINKIRKEIELIFLKKEKNGISRVE